MSDTALNTAFLNRLLDDATQPFLGGGRFAYHFARGKLNGDPIFRELLRQGLLPQQGRFLDLGCGQGSLFSWLLSARALYEKGQWPASWPEPPKPDQLRGVELMDKDVFRAARAFGTHHPVVRIEQGDMCRTDFGRADVITILDALHYIDHASQEDVLRRVHAALPPGGLFLTRIGDVSAGLPYHVSNWVDQVVTFARGHRLPRLYARPLADWRALLQSAGFEVASQNMSGEKPFANVMLVCRTSS